MPEISWTITLKELGKVGRKNEYWNFMYASIFKNIIYIKDVERILYENINTIYLSITNIFLKKHQY